MSYKNSTTTPYYNVPQKLYILAQLALGELTDPQAIDKYLLNPT